ncbi:MAG: M1 family metallopeptidase [Phycisphaerales bacterium]
MKTTLLNPAMLLALAGLAAPSAAAEEDGCASGSLEAAAWSQSGDAPLGFDEASGRSTARFAPDRNCDHEHMRLHITIPDMNTPKAACRMQLRVRPIARPMDTMTLDARAMKVESVSCEGYTTSFDHDGRVLTVHISPPAPPGESVTLDVAYSLDDPARGLIWTPESDRYPGRAAQIHTQGQTDTNSFWFPCHDSPDEKLTTEIVADVPSGFVVSSNGRLTEHASAMIRVPGPLGEPRLQQAETWHFVQDKPHAPYLVSLVVGKFDVVDVGDSHLPMPVYAPPGRGADARKTYANTPRMVEFFSHRLGEPYAWDKYAQVVVWNFEAGGMENTSATSMHDNAVVSDEAREDYDLDGLISHELGHQWFGDLTTCNTWDEVWLNEGFATYMTDLWFEQRDGLDRYDEQVRDHMDGVLGADRGSAPTSHAMMSRVWDAAWENFRRPGNPYPKGAAILHMLRRELGDAVFFGALHDYLEQRKFSTVQTWMLRQAFEKRSGRQLERFFEQWTLRPGTPTVAVSWTYDPQRRKLRFTTAQKQTIDADNPAFEFSLPVFVRNSAGPDVVIEPFLFAKSDTFEVDLEGPPRFVAIDPDQHVLAKYEVTQDPAMWLTQAQQGPTLVSRIAAIRALAASHESAASEYLRRAASDQSEKKWARVEAIKALTARGDAPDVRGLVSSARDTWEVRLAVTDGLVSLLQTDKWKGDPSLRQFTARTLANRAGSDESLRVRCAAVRGLGRLNMTEHENLVREAIEVSSQNDDMRQAGLAALADLRTPDALDVMIAYAQEGSDNRTRGAAIDLIGKLSSPRDGLAPRQKDREAGVKALGALASTRSARPRFSAIEALAEVGDAAGLPFLTAAEKQAAAPELAARIRQQREKLEKKLSEAR